MEYFAHSQKAFLYKYVVMLSDADQFKHMSFANYLKLMFLATDALFLSCFDETFLAENRIKMIKSRMQFKKQTVVGEKMIIKINATQINKSRYSLLHTFTIENSADLVVLGRQTYELSKINGDEVEKLPENIEKLLTPIIVDEEHLLYKY